MTDRRLIKNSTHRVPAKEYVEVWGNKAALYIGTRKDFVEVDPSDVAALADACHRYQVNMELDRPDVPFRGASLGDSYLSAWSDDE